jgi:hypothetical protein
MDNASPFAPPRAGRAAGFWRAWFRVCRNLRPVVLRIPPNLRLPPQPWMPFAVVCVPLLGLYHSRLRAFAGIAAGLYGLFCFVALGAYGQFLGSIAFGLTIAIHAAGVVAYLDAKAPAENVIHRIVRQLFVVLAVSLLVPVFVGRVLDRVVIPVAGPDGTLLINPFARSQPLLTGEIVAYKMESAREQGFTLAEGVYLGRVLGGPGNEIVFATGFYSLNGIDRPALPHMPVTGRYKTEVGQSIVWPTVFFAYGNFSGRTFPVHRAVVDDSALVGRPYKRWFWRTQSP